MATASKVALLKIVFDAMRGQMANRPMSEVLSAIPRWAKAVLSGRYTQSTRGKLAMMAGAIVYLFSPVDLVPELLVGPLGLFDDAFIVGWLVKNFVGEIGEFLDWEIGAGSGAQNTSHHPGQSSEDVIQGTIIE